MIPLGVNVPNFGPEAQPATLLDWAQFAEESGFRTLVVSDHVAPTPEVRALYPDPFYDPLQLLTWLAPQTNTLRLGTSVLVLPYRHPLLTARLAATLQLLSGNRFVLGVGSGWAATEFAALGLDATARGRMTDAALDVVTRAWQGPTVSGDGFADVGTGPLSPAGPPPLWVGGASPAAIRRAARYADAWHPINPRLEWLRDNGIPALNEAAQRIGRPAPELVPRIKARLSQHPVTAADRPLGVGTVEQVAADVAALAALGAAEVILDTNPDSPRPRDFAAEQRQLLEIRDALR